ncbi:hypothetical protein ACFFKU_10380 [Kineococcus gynurae]|uniref:MFS transporter n=1 Tax=Kineococcus gynurae TaxID=452979 RepID=A0ABV5LUY6_9ACTN
MARTLSRSLSRRNSLSLSRSRSRSRRRPGSGRVSPRVVAGLVAVALIIANVLLVLGPVLGLVGAVAGSGPVVDIPYLSMTVLTVLGFVIALLLAGLAYLTYRPALRWTAVVLAWLVSLLASVWPIVATADAAVDRLRDILPWITETIRTLG